MNGLMIKVNPTNIELLLHIYAIAKDRSKSTIFPKVNTFLECRDSTYIYIDKCYKDMKYPIIDGIISCRRTTMEEIGVETLQFYPLPNHIVYSIEIFDIIQCINENKMSIAKELLNTIYIDKNDAFIVIKFFDRYGNVLTNDVKDILSEYGYDFFSYRECIYTYVKRPTMLLNRSE